MTIAIWEILVPKTWETAKDWSSNVPIATHKAWDEKVMSITGGMTIMRSARGTWQDLHGDVIEESMIPVRVACTAAQIEEIVQLTLDHYRQDAVMAYKVSSDVIFRYRGDTV